MILKKIIIITLKNDYERSLDYASDYYAIKIMDIKTPNYINSYKLIDLDILPVSMMSLYFSTNKLTIRLIPSIIFRGLCHTRIISIKNTTLALPLLYN